MWRWSHLAVGITLTGTVFSTYVEVILGLWENWWIDRRILHVCGGDPFDTWHTIVSISYSPRMWRWSWYEDYSQQTWFVFSTYVEVIPGMDSRGKLYAGILHVCGGDPIGAVAVVSNSKYSPRMWRWSYEMEVLWCQDYVFSTYVEVILTDLVGAVLDWGILHTCWECYCPWAHR